MAEFFQLAFRLDCWQRHFEKTKGFLCRTRQMDAFHDKGSSEWRGCILASCGVHHGTVRWHMCWIQSSGFTRMGQKCVTAVNPFLLTCEDCLVSKETSSHSTTARCTSLERCTVHILVMSATNLLRSQSVYNTRQSRNVDNVQKS